MKEEKDTGKSRLRESRRLTKGPATKARRTTKGNICILLLSPEEHPGKTFHREKKNTRAQKCSNDNEVATKAFF